MTTVACDFPFMSDYPTVREPSVATVLRQQFSLLDMRQLFPLLLGLFAAAALLGSVFAPEFPFIAPEEFLPLQTFLLVAVAWPMIVWQGQGPTQRHYHRSLPVDTYAHDMLKLAAGACYMLLAEAMVLATLVVALVVSGESDILFRLPPVVLVNFFTSTLIVYLFASLVPMLVDRMLEWTIGISVGIFALGLLHESYRLPVVPKIFQYFRFTLSEAYEQQPWDFILGASSIYRRVSLSEPDWVAATTFALILGAVAVSAASYIAARK